MFEWAATMLSQGSSSGAIDVVAVRDSLGNLSCSPFHVKLNKPAQKGDSCRIVKLTVNSKDVALSMKIGSAGEAFFVERTNLKSLSRNAIDPQANSSGFEQGTTSTKTVPQVPQQSLFVAAEGNSNATRRRQRSFSDGDIDGDYKYLLDEQVIMALSLCAPVSFHHEKDIDCSDASFKQKNIPTPSVHSIESKVADSAKGVSVIAPTNSSSPTLLSSNTPFSATLGNHNEDIKGIENDANLPKRVRSVSDTQESRGTFERDSGGQSHVPIAIEGHIDQLLGIKSFGTKSPELAVLSPVAALAHQVLPPALFGSVKGSYQGIQSEEKTTKLSDAQAAVANKLVETEVTNSAALRVAATPPSWSWTWGALPVKSKIKPAADVLVQDRTGGTDAGAPVIVEIALSKASSSNITDAVEHRCVAPDSAPSCVALSEEGLNLDSESHNRCLNFELGVSDGNPVEISGDGQNSLDCRKHGAHDSDDFKLTSVDNCLDQRPLKLYDQHPTMGSKDEEKCGDFVLNVLQEETINIQDAEASTNISGTHRDHSDSPSDSTMTGSEREIADHACKGEITSSDAIQSGRGIFSEGDGDGDTDQELDTLSLHDIPLDQISPEPAGGDFYDSDTESYLSLSLDDGDIAKIPPRSKFGKYRYRRVLVPSQEQLLSLDLQDGENEIRFALQRQESKGAYSSATPLLRNQLFVWPHNAKIVIIDIEGVITTVNKGGKGWGMSDFLSAPRTAVHNGVAKLLTNIHNNGYRILYIAQSTSTALSTKEHLAKIGAGSDINLPPGPVFQSPDSLIKAFGAARTDLFKAAALRGLKSLFPAAHNPFYACFGTRPCDMVAFARCGVPEARIFIVSPDSGEISGMNRTYRSSYEQVNEVLHEMFPAVSDNQSRTLFFQCPSPTSAAYGSSSTSTSGRYDTISPRLGSAAGSMSQSTKSVGDLACSLAEEDFSDFNFWKIPHVALT